MNGCEMSVKTHLWSDGTVGLLGVLRNNIGTVKTEFENIGILFKAVIRIFKVPIAVIKKNKTDTPLSAPFL